MTDRLNDLYPLRLARWRQTPGGRVPDPAAATAFINHAGFVTLYGVSPEVPDLFHAYTGDPLTKPEESWDSPSGHVYGWRWDLGRSRAAFYTPWVRGKPTWVSWELLPAVLRLRADLRSSRELAGSISADALRVLEALEDTGGELRTGDLRQIAGFPIGRSERAAYLKAVDELEARMVLAKTFSQHDLDMRHSLVRERYAEHVSAACELDEAGAMDRLVTVYLALAVYALPDVLARHLRVPPGDLTAAFDRLVMRGSAERVPLGARRVAYVERMGH